MDRLFEIAPPSTWIRVAAATLLILLAVIAYSHYQVVTRAYGEARDGIMSVTRPAALLRATAAGVSAGLLLWGYGLGWPVPVLAVLAIVAIGSIVAELAARVAGTPRA